MDFIFNYICMPVLVLALIIFVHELGHFLAARYFKISTPVFSVGFGKEILGYTDSKGTRWKLSIFPLGGYVSIENKDTDSLIARTIVALAGPMANFLSAILLMVAISLFYGTPKTPMTIVALNINAGAYKAGMLPQDNLVSMNGISTPYDMDDIKDFIQAAPSDSMDALIVRDGAEKKLSIEIRPFDKTDDFGDKQKQRMLGVVFAGQNFKLSAINSVDGINTEGNVALARQELLKHFDKNIVINFGKGEEREDFLIHVDGALNKGLSIEGSPKYSTLVMWDERRTEFAKMGVYQSIKSSISLVYQACKVTLGVIYQIIVGKKGTDDLGGVVAISSMTGEVSEQASVVGIYYILRLLVVLSASIGFINLFPLPMLDGGHLVFYAMEAVQGRPPSLKLKGYFYGVSIMFLLILSLLVGYRDIVERLNN